MNCTCHVCEGRQFFTTLQVFQPRLFTGLFFLQYWNIRTGRYSLDPDPKTMKCFWFHWQWWYTTSFGLVYLIYHLSVLKICARYNGTNGYAAMATVDFHLTRLGGFHGMKFLTAPWSWSLEKQSWVNMTSWEKAYDTSLGLHSQSISSINFGGQLVDQPFLATWWCRCMRTSPNILHLTLLLCFCWTEMLTVDYQWLCSQWISLVSIMIFQC